MSQKLYGKIIVGLEWKLRTSGTLRTVYCLFLTENSGQQIGFIFKAKSSWPLKIEPVTNYRYTLCNIPEECSSYVLSSGNLKSRKFNIIVTFSCTRNWQVSITVFNVPYVTHINSYIRYTCTVTTCRITTVSYLPPPLPFLFRGYTQAFKSAVKGIYPVWRVLLVVSFLLFGLSVLNNFDTIHRLDPGKFLPFPACSGLC